MTGQRQKEQEWLYQLRSVLLARERAHVHVVVVQIRVHMCLAIFHGVTQPLNVRTDHPESILVTRVETSPFVPRRVVWSARK